MSDETVSPGDLVLTSGGDGIFPKGLPVGTVTKVSPGSELFLNIRVRPTANLNRLEEVLVVTKIDERQAQPEQAGPVRAVDILAERLPSVPAKTDATAAAPSKNPVPAGATPATTPSTATPTNTAKPKTANVSGAANTPVASTNSPPGTAANTTIPKSAVPAHTTTVDGAQRPAGSNGATSIPGGTPMKKLAPASSPNGAAIDSAPAAAGGTKPATKPVNPTGTPNPQTPTQDSPQ
jgi:rod shape-determining protein MreC